MSWMHKIVAIIFLGLVGVSGSVYSACYNDCKPLPDCEAMGYKLEKDIFCPDGAITCPFDSRYKWCKEYTCKDGRYSDTEMLTGERGYRCDAVDYHKRTCYYCRCDPDPNECKWSNLNKGYGEISDGCCDGHFATCKSLCQDTVTVPAHAHGLEESCTGCGETKNIITDWDCDKWWDEYNGECFPHPCEDNYTITEPDLESCGELGLGDKGWTWKSNGYMGEQICGKCTAKSCLDGFSTQFPSVESCGEKGGAGWDFEKSEQYAGDDVCGKCAMKQCPEGFESGKASADDCGKHGSTGWQYEQSDTFNGNTACGKCTAKQCPAHSAVEVQNCGETGSNGYRLGTTAGWNGENECKTCEPLTCEKDTATTETGCGETGNKGWKLGTPTGKYEGETPCKPCIKLDCPKDTQTAWSDPKNCGSNGTMNGWTSESTDSYNGNVQCYRCTAKQCPKDYDTSKPNVESCGTTGGWTWDGKDYSGDKICGKCTAKPCEGFGLLQCPDHGSCDTCQNGNTLKHKLKSCDHGWHVENDKCVEDACDGYNLKECPQHGSCGTCQKGATLMYKLESCHNGWNKVNDTCVMNECKDHAPTAAQCSSNTCQGNGWTVNNNETCQKGDTQTYQCVKKACPNNESTDYKDVTKCGTQGNNGWTSSETTSCNGDVRCYKCEKKSCAQGFDTAHQDVNSCGKKGSTGWNWQQNGWSGDDKCGKCEAKTCAYTAAPQNAHCTVTCYAGDAEQCSTWVCNEGYQQTADGKGCEVKPCENGYAITADKCGNGKGGYDLGDQGSKSGTNTCRKCVAKTCPSSENTEYSDVSKCGTVGGWTSSATGHYAGEKECYQCNIKPCAQGFDTNHQDVNSCGNKGSAGWDWSQSGYSGNSKCGKCTKRNCPSGYNTDKPDEKSCGTTNGWNFSASSTYNGEAVCGKCEPKNCPNNESTDSSVSKCGTSGGWNRVTSGSYSGNNPCYKCEPKTCSQEVTPPDNAECSEHCTTGDKTICVKWQCSKGYTQNNNVCNITQCPKDSATSTSGCGNGTHPAGWKLGATNGTWSGSSECKKCEVQPCAEGDTSSTDVSKCGYSGTVGASKTATGGYSGDNACYKCVCNASASECKWTEQNKGTATLGDLCCNNMYAKCTSTCRAATKIDNADCTKTCKGCDNAEVCVEWTCKKGYTKTNGVCVVSKCPQGSGITASDCGTHAEGWELGNATGAQSGSNACKECKAKSCSGGYSTAKQSVNDCTTNSCANYHSEGYSGDQKCGICYYSVDVDMPDHAKCAETSSCQKGTYCSKWKCEDGYIASGNTCIRHDTGCVKNPEPANATCNERCYLNGTQVCKKWSCNQKYTELNGTCVRHDSGCVQNDAPNYANCDSKCYLNGKEVCSKWSCKQGYTSNGSSCVVASCPDGSATSASNCGSYSAGWNLGSSVTGYSGNSSCYRCEAKVCPANQITTTDASACGTNGGWKRVTSGSYSGDKACYRCEANTCPSKETTTSSGAGCGSTGDTGWTRVASGSYAGNSPCYKCQARTCATNVSLPNNASCAEYCTAGDDKRCIRWTCNQGYTSNGSSCSVASCPKGSATTANDCGSHPTGWKLGTEVMGYSGTSTCKKCEAKDCPTGEDKNTSTSSCSTNHPLGYYKNASGSYSGDNTCYKCVERACPDGESTSNSGAGCGKTGVNGWTRVASSNYAGETQCYKCKEKTCNSGYSITYQSANDCSNTGCWKFSSDGYAGDKICGKCTSGGSDVSIPDHAHCISAYPCDKGSYCSSWTCNAGYTEILGSCVEALVADTCTQCTSGYECTRKSSNGAIEIKCVNFQMAGYTCVKCSSGGLTPVDPVFPVDPDPTPTTGCPSGYATDATTGCMASINQTCTLDKTKSNGSYNGKTCYKCSCTTSGGGTLLPDCPFDCSNCPGGLKCSTKSQIGDCFCMAKAPVGDLVP